MPRRVSTGMIRLSMRLQWYGRTVHPLTLQSKLLGDVPCAIVDDRKQKEALKQEHMPDVPTGFHARADVYYVMKQVGQEIGAVLRERNEEFKRHGIAATHYEHGLFAFGRNVEEAFDNGYRAYRNAQTIVYSRLLSDYPDEKLEQNAGPGDTDIPTGK